MQGGCKLFLWLWGETQTSGPFVLVMEDLGYVLLFPILAQCALILLVPDPSYFPTGQESL